MHRYFLVKFDASGIPKSYINKELFMVSADELREVSTLLSAIAFAVMNIASKFGAGIVHVIKYTETQRGLSEDELKLFVAQKEGILIFYECIGSIINERLFDENNPLRHLTSFTPPPLNAFSKISESDREIFSSFVNLADAFIKILPQFSFRYMSFTSIFPSRLADVLYLITNGALDGVLVKESCGRENLLVRCKERPKTYGEIKESENLWSWLRFFSIDTKDVEEK
ncbi:MAG: hypothetical protein QXL15_00135 [Candidatus Korarchaeota archaeon]